MVLNELIYSTAMNKCPRCHRGPVFTTNNPYGAGAFRMNESCSCCGLKYEREPGFFYGALYVSYALMSGLFIVWFVGDQVWLHMKTQYLLLAVVSTILLLFPVVLRSSRLIWLNFFVRYDKERACAKDMQHLENETSGKENLFI